jgi:hypothetical protein
MEGLLARCGAVEFFGLAVNVKAVLQTTVHAVLDRSTPLPRHILTRTVRYGPNPGVAELASCRTDLDCNDVQSIERG